MIDLSNNNVGKENFARVFASGQRRVYLKLTESNNFVDQLHGDRRKYAIKAGLKVGEYHFAHPLQHTPHEEATFFLRRLPKLTHAHSMRPCLDIEWGKASAKVGEWAVEFVKIVRKQSGHKVIIYGNPYFLASCHFTKPPGPLWLASYGRNDQKEYAFQIPSPWKTCAAHQYSSVYRMAGIVGECDMSHVFKPRSLDIAK